MAVFGDQEKVIVLFQNHALAEFGCFEGHLVCQERERGSAPRKEPW
jgi:hypothetical protein